MRKEMEQEISTQQKAAERFRSYQKKIKQENKRQEALVKERRKTPFRSWAKKMLGQNADKCAEFILDKGECQKVIPLQINEEVSQVFLWAGVDNKGLFFFVAVWLETSVSGEFKNSEKGADNRTLDKIRDAENVVFNELEIETVVEWEQDNEETCGRTKKNKVGDLLKEAPGPFKL